MGQIVGAALVSHHPGLFQTDEFRLEAGAGRDSDLIPGYDRVRAKIETVKPDVLVIFDTHWFTTGCHLVAGGAHYSGIYISDEMPWYLHDREYDYDGAPDLAELCVAIAQERRIPAKNANEPDLPRHYATINIVAKLRRNERVLSVGSCQTAKTHHFLQMGEAVGEAVRRSPYRAVLLGSGALSHKFNDLDWVQKSPRIYDAANVSDPRLAASDRKAIEVLETGRHDAVLENFAEYRAIPWEARGAHYLQMIAALGGCECRSKGEVLSEYENARGTGNVHIWFPVEHV
jgi:aromatic ring-opening dioxygenase catalytic subunit (LigB family)